ncbi:uncharacterized protein LOC130827397 [Amaranthus tricolor]|uniref:uncharacterized protein LOC130827397 n=1 Tax=Amaranthus tricolor TaxID=29722 RepID=UPI0025896358|nr:uncharacterized protein LOC130827397 [Amaranthus tricolor]
MASTLRVGLQKGIQYKEIVNGSLFTLTRFIHGFALPPSMDSTLSPPLTLPHQSDSDYSCQYPGFAPGGGSMDLTAVPKKKVSKHKRGIRNGPKALKPTPVIIRCKSCGRVKLPHFYCCGGRREDLGDAAN